MPVFDPWTHPPDRTFELGEAFQFDWSEEGLVVGGIHYTMQVAHLKLCASRAFWLVAYPSQGHEMPFDAHARTFAALGGIPRRGIYDNMRTAVDKVRRGKGRTVNPRFAAMCAYYLFDPDVCNVASGWEERRVEKDVQDSRRRIWVEARDRHFGSFEELNAWLAERCRALWAELKHSEYPALTIAEMLEHEQAYLMPMPAPFDGYIEKPARVSSTCLVSVDRNRYSVPCALAGKRVSTRLYPDRMVVVAEDQLVARHARLRNEGHTAYDWQHYIPLLKRKPGALRNGRTVRRSAHAAAAAAASSPARAWWRPGDGAGTGARTRGWAEVVLVAVDLALEADPPSGRVRVEHVQNVLTRLHEPALPPPVAASLRVATPPLADPARYDRCRSRKPAGRCRSTSSASSTSTPASSSPPTSTSANGPGCSAM